MTGKQVAEMTVEELKVLMTSVFDEQISAIKACLLQEISDLIESKGKRDQVLIDQDAYVLPKRTKEEQHEINQALIEWYRKWAEEGDEQEQRETLEYLQKALDEDRLVIEAEETYPRG